MEETVKVDFSVEHREYAKNKCMEVIKELEKIQNQLGNSRNVLALQMGLGPFEPISMDDIYFDQSIQAFIKIHPNITNDEAIRRLKAKDERIHYDLALAIKCNEALDCLYEGRKETQLKLAKKRSKRSKLSAKKN